MRYTTAIAISLLSQASVANNAPSTNTTANNIEEVVVRGEVGTPLTEPTLETQKLFAVPGAEGDPLQAIFSLPGVLFAEDDGGEPAVRGSAPEDNIFLVDGLPVTHIYHPFGFSVFNKHVIGDFSLLPAAYPAQYNAATGAVFDITLRDPRKQAMTYTLDYSLLRTGALMEGQIAENQAIYLSYRRSLIDVYFDADDLNEDDGSEDDEGINIINIPKMSDYQGKYVWNINEQNKLSVLFMGSKNDFALDIEEDAAEALIDPDIAGRISYDDKFNSQSVSWLSHNGQNSLQITLGHINAEEDIALGTGQFLTIKDETHIIKSRYSHPVNTDHTLTFGVESQKTETQYAFDLKINPCSDFQPDCFPNNDDRQQDKDTLSLSHYAIYAEDRWQMHPDINVTLGLNISDDSYYQEQLTEPRASVNWQYHSDWQLSLATGVYHRTPSPEQGLKDIGNPGLKNFKAKHYTTSLKHDPDNSWRWQVELYYKDLYDLPIALSETDPDVELNYVNEAEGKAYGIELLLEKDLTDKWYGWVSASFAKSERTDLRNNKTSDFTGDTPVVINAVLSYQINTQWNIGARYTWRTGAAYTPIIGLSPNPDYPTLFRPVYGELNAKRLPHYQRLDLRAEKQFLFAKKEASFIFEIINAFNNDNISGYSYDPKPTDSATNFSLDTEKGLSFFPSIGVQIKI